MAPENSSNEEIVEEPETTDVEEEHSVELSDTAASQLTPPENTCPGIGRTRRLSDFRAWFAENFRHCSESEEGKPKHYKYL